MSEEQHCDPGTQIPTVQQWFIGVCEAVQKLPEIVE